MTSNYELYNIDPEEIEDVLVKVESSFDIKFENNELANSTTFGELCDHITSKIELENSDDCTSQQAFYKLRSAISSTLKLDGKIISLDTLLSDILPRKGRRLGIKQLENHLGFKLNILRPPHWAIASLLIIFLASLIGLYFNWQFGLLGLGFSISGFWVAHKIGNEFDVQTIRQVVEKMTRENYIKARRNASTFNKNEVEKALTDLFSADLDLEKSKLSREARIR